MAVRKDHFGCLGELSWRLTGTLSTTEVSFLTLFAHAYACAYAYVVDLQQLPKYKYSAQIRHYCRGRNLTIFDKDDDSGAWTALKFLQLSMGVRYDFYVLDGMFSEIYFFFKGGGSWSRLWSPPCARALHTAISVITSQVHYLAYTVRLLKELCTHKEGKALNFLSLITKVKLDIL